MPIAVTVETCLERNRLPYAVISHPPAPSGRDTAAAAAVALGEIAAPVMLGDERGHLMVVVPGDRRVPVRRISRQLGRRLRVLKEPEVAPLFADCEPGAVPPLGPAYGIETIVDDSLYDQPRVCFIAGDHDELVCVSQEVFRRLTEGARSEPLTRGTPAAEHR